MSAGRLGFVVALFGIFWSAAGDWRGDRIFTGDAPISRWLSLNNSKSNKASIELEEILHLFEASVQRAKCKNRNYGKPYVAFGERHYSHFEWITYALEGSRALGLHVDANTSCPREHSAIIDKSPLLLRIFRFQSKTAKLRQHFAKFFHVEAETENTHTRKPYYCIANSFSAIRSLGLHGTFRWHIAFTMDSSSFQQFDIQKYLKSIFLKDNLPIDQFYWTLEEFIHVSERPNSSPYRIIEPLQFHPPKWNIYLGDKNATTILTVFQSMWMRRYPISRAYVAKSRALQIAHERMLKKEKDYQHARETLSPSNMAILLLPLYMTLFPFAALGIFGHRKLIINALLVDVAPVLPLLIEGLHLRSLRSANTKALNIWTLGNFSDSSRSDSIAEVSFASCRHSGHSSRLPWYVGSIGQHDDILLIIVAVVFMVAGIAIEVIAACVISRRQQKQNAEAQATSPEQYVSIRMCKRCGCDNFVDISQTRSPDELSLLCCREDYLIAGCNKTQRWPILGSLLHGGSRISGQYEDKET